MAFSSWPALELRGGNLFMGMGGGGGGTKEQGSPICCPLLDVRRFHNPSPSLRLKRLRRRRTAHAVLMADAAAATGPPSLSIGLDPFLHGGQAASYVLNENNKEEREPVTQEKLDEWLTDSIGEIVRNIGEAPFLVHFFSGGPRRSPSMVRLEREAASLESWSQITKRWDQGSRMPDGVILVEELKDEVEERNSSCNDGHHCARTWGLVVQCRGMDCAACYILNTCRVRSSTGFCTHFCLVRAKCFGEPTDTQFRNAWLQGR